MEMRLRAPVTRGYFFLLGALRLVNAASPRNIDQKKISSGIQGKSSYVGQGKCGLLKRGTHGSWSGAIIGDEDRKSWDPRGPMIWDNFSIFRKNCAILTSYIHALVVVSRVDVVTLRDQLLRIGRFSCGFFTAITGNKEPELFYVLLCS